jgi:hypothetical protein
MQEKQQFYVNENFFQSKITKINLKILFYFANFEFYFSFKLKNSR